MGIMNKLHKIFIVLFVSFFIINGCQYEKNSDLNNSTKLLVKLLPQKITFPSGSNGDVQAEIDQAWNLFDRNTESSYFAKSIKLFELHLARIEEIGSIRVFGDPDNILNIKSKGNEISFEKRNDTSEENVWHSLVFPRPIKTQNITIEMLGNVGELEVWGHDIRSNMRSASLNKHNFVTLHSLPSNFVASKGSTASVNLNITMDPCSFNRVFLKYESDQYLPVSIARQINGHSVAGGLSVQNNDKIIRDHSEEINPEWLVRGKNTIEFKSEGSDFSIKNIRIELLGDDGWNSVSSVSETGIFDRDINTSEEISISQGDILIHFVRKVSPYELKFFLPEVQQVKGQLTVCNNGRWRNVRDFEIDFSGMNKGWNSIVVPEGTTSESLKIDFSGKDNAFHVNEIQVSASPVGSDVPRIVVSYPKKGEFFGRTAYIQGFVTPMQEVNSVTIEGIKDSRNSSDGSFSMALSKDQTRFSNQKDNAPWDPVIRASVQGNILKHELNLYSNHSEDYNDANPLEEIDDKISDDVVGSDGIFRTTLDPNMSKIISFQNVRMNIPAGAVDKVTEITITPLNWSDLKDLDPGMINVTFPAAGYRFLPHGKFKKPIEIYFHYARELLKRGQKDDDIFMHYYDEEAKKWKRLDRIDVEKDVQLVRSVTDHFTDIINATLTIPEHPDPLSHNPNAIKDLKAGSPTNAINMIEPPKGTNLGDANLNYPIVVPKGLNGMQPDLAVKYSSESANGMMGLGWNIPMRSITVDTRFGVPRYNGDEVYFLEGMKLVPDPERPNYYRPKVEGSFNLIQRIGTGPGNYYWKVTDKNGKQYFYGMNPSSRLSNPDPDNNNIFEWCLEKVIDVHGNNIKYYYLTDTLQSTEPGRSIYLYKINYTGTGNSDGHYSVQFAYSDERPDMIVNCRSGFKMVLRYKLSAVNVFSGISRVRRYEFKYRTGAFNKLLLKEIQTYGEYGSDGLGYFYKHDFEYYNEIAYDPSRRNISIDGFSDTKEDYSIYKRMLKFKSDLGSNFGFGGSVDMFAGYSPPFTGGLKGTSIGGRFGAGFDSSMGIGDLVDVNGDGLVDRMNAKSYVLNTTPVGSDKVTWGDVIPIFNLGTSLEDNTGWGITVGGSVYSFGIGIFSDYNFGETTSDRYLMDMNADFRTDIVSEGNVKYNNPGIIDGNEEEARFENVSHIPLGVSDITADISDEPDDPEWEADKSQWEEKTSDDGLADTYYRDDPVRMWKAPYDGIVKITGDVSLFTEKMEEELQFSNDIKYLVDGVAVSIQKGKNVMWSREIRPSFKEVNNGSSVQYRPARVSVTPGNVNSIRVDKGDCIYFRVNSIYDGSYDIVEWDPVVTYINTDTSIEDENGLNLYRFQASEDFSLISTDVAVNAAYDGTIAINGDVLKKKGTTDDIFVKITISTPEYDVNGNPTAVMASTNKVYNEKISWDESDDTSPVASVNLYDIIVKKDDVILCELFSYSTVDWRQISWKPVISYKRITYENQSFQLDPGTGKLVYDDEGNPVVETTIEDVDVDDLLNVSDSSLPQDYENSKKPSMDFFAPVSVSHYPIIENGPVHGWEVGPDFSGSNVLSYSVMLYKEDDPFGNGLSTMDDMPVGYETSLSFAVKRKNAVTGMNELVARNNCIIRNTGNGPEIVGVDEDGVETLYIENSVDFMLELNDLNQGDNLFFVYSSKRNDIKKYMTFSDPEIASSMLSSDTVSVHAVLRTAFDDTEEALLYGGGFRNWYYGRWNGEIKTDGEDKLDPAMMVINKSEVVDRVDLTEEKIEDIINKNSADEYTDITAEFSITNRLNVFSPMIAEANYYWTSDGANKNIKKWQRRSPAQLSDVSTKNISVYVGNDSDTWISPTMMSSTRMMRKNLSNAVSGYGMTFAENDTRDEGQVHDGRGRAINRSTRQTGFVVGMGALANIVISKSEMKTSADMFDFNGDSYPDIVKNGHVRFTRRDGSLGESKRIEGFSYVRESESTNETKGISRGVDGSMQKTSFMGNGRIVGQKADFTTPGVSFYAGKGVTNSKNDFIDINGDGLPDRIYNNGTVRLNLGYRLGAVETIDFEGITVNKTTNVNTGGTVGFSNDKGAWGGGMFINSSQAGVESTYIDINGDGLPDRVTKPLKVISGLGIKAEENEKLKVKFNTGKGFTDAYDWNGGSEELPLSSDQAIEVNIGTNFSVKIKLFAVFVPIGTILINPGIGENLSYGKVESRLMDVNGDGYVDQVYPGSRGKVRANFNRTGRTNLLRKVNRPLGGSFEIAYNREGNTTNMPHSKWVLGKVTLHDGMNDSEGGVHKYTSSYDYDNGFYDLIEREFYGFKTVTSRSGENDDTQEIIRTFLNKVYYERGLEKSSVMKDSEGNVYTKSVNDYVYRQLCKGSRFTYLDKKYSYFYEGTTADENTAAPKWTYKEFDYDEYGNVSKYIDYGEPGIVSDDVTAVLHYDFRPDPYIMSKPDNILVVGHDGSILRKREGVYDSKGNLRQQQVYLDSAHHSLVNMEYYDNGTVKTVIGAPNERGQRYYMQYEYDPKVKTYVVEKKDAFGLSSYTKYDYKYGQPLSTIDTNGNTMFYSYDFYGRIRSIWAPYEIGNSIPTVEYIYNHTAQPAYTRTLNKEDRNSAKTIDTVVFVDGLGRTIQTQNSHEVSGVAGRSVSGKVVFDSLGRRIANGQPVFISDKNFSYVNASVLNPTVFVLDVRNRKREIQHADGTSDTFEYSFKTDAGVSLFSTLTEDRNGKSKETLKDIRGLIKKIIEYVPEDKDVETSYGYNAMKEIVSVTDHDGNKTFAGYDMAGRRTSMHNPDTGTVSMFYDPAGNLIRKITPNLRETGESIKYTYFYKRLIKVNYPNMSDIIYTYGNPGESWNRAGRIAVVDNGNMNEKLYYGQLGETLKSKRSIKTSKGTRTFTTRFEWDNLGKMNKLYYPDGEVLYYEYNSGGLLKSAIGWQNEEKNVYVKEIQYDKFTQKKKVTLGNDVTTVYTYNPLNRRLENLNTKAPDGTVFQNITYKFDDVGNVKKRKNEGFVTGEKIVKNSIQSYEYDSLHRLTGSEGSYDHERWVPIFDKRVNSYTNSFTYDGIGNMLTKNQTNSGLFPDTGETLTIDKTSYDYSYKYDSFRPHAATTVGPKTLTYDANGNMTRMQNSVSGLDRQLSWDDENRLIQSNDLFAVDAPGKKEKSEENSKESTDAVTTYKYDSSGNRIVKNGKFGEVVYVNSNYTMRNDAVIGKHVFAGSTRVASKLVMVDTLENSSIEEVETPVLDEGIYYYHGDHLGSSSVVTNKNGQFHEHIEYFPYGETWVHEKNGDKAMSMRYKFTGKEQDPETGLYYYGARYYDPVISKWISVDPILNDYLPSNNKKNMPAGGIFRSSNLGMYSYVGNRPVNYIDPTGKYDVDVHLYLTQYLAGKAGFNKQEAHIIAAADQGVDENPATNPMKLRKDMFSVLAEWHFPVDHYKDKTKRNNEPARKKVDAAIKDVDNSTLEDFGKALHTFQDSYAHEGYGPIYGHILAGHDPDKTFKDVDKAMEMSHETYKCMKAYRQKRGLKNRKGSWKKLAPRVRKKMNKYSRKYHPQDNRK